ncbi:pilus assembly protein [Aquibacillus halophilus]|uniref:Pilus assembly protein n=1 Tax=Aquibacillus halophilus TaxID=930132 RepID=A0A6A8DSY6_9BACI|nr:TadE/TadG family type IV pilus assembly protein [Aquibacillus halophilus]MRH44322.1 pilus assembly protein [Aquibacillus halophilus]
MKRDERGQSIVEFALVLPLLLFLLVGMLDFGRILYSYSALHFTAQETVRLGGFGRDDAAIIQFARDNFTAGDSALLEVDITPGQSLRASGDYVTVSLTYPIQSMTPIINDVLPSDFSLRVNSTIRIE